MPSTSFLDDAGSRPSAISSSLTLRALARRPDECFSANASAGNKIKSLDGGGKDEYEMMGFLSLLRVFGFVLGFNVDALGFFDAGTLTVVDDDDMIDW